MFKVNLNILAYINAILLLYSCKTNTNNIENGLQENYKSINFAKIIVLSPVIQINPTQKSEIDVSVYNLENISQQIEKNIIFAFTNQPGINGLSPKAVNNKLLNTNFQTDMLNLLKKSTENFKSNKSVLCKNSINFLSFYVNCVSENLEWKNALNNLATNLLNGDALLLTTVNHLIKTTNKGKIHLSMGINSLLIDTNNGRLIWGRENKEELTEDAISKSALSFNLLINKIMSEPFWIAFPGRVFR